MTRWIFIGFLFLAGLLLVSMARIRSSHSEVPYFLRYDSLALNASPQIDIQVNSIEKPDIVQLEKLEKDYIAIWAHLNYLYQHPDPRPSQERFTERFYRNLAKNYQKGEAGSIQRKDSQHHLFIKTWSRDGLSCNLLDRDAQLTYLFPDGSSQTVTATVAVSLLFQGDNWRLDAIRFINEIPNQPHL